MLPTFPEKECFLEKTVPVEKYWGQAVSHLEGALRHSALLESPSTLRGRLVASTPGLRNLKPSRKPGQSQARREALVVVWQPG